MKALQQHGGRRRSCDDWKRDELTVGRRRTWLWTVTLYLIHVSAFPLERFHPASEVIVRSFVCKQKG